LLAGLRKKTTQKIRRKFTWSTEETVRF